MTGVVGRGDRNKPADCMTLRGGNVVFEPVSLSGSAGCASQAGVGEANGPGFVRLLGVLDYVRNSYSGLSNLDLLEEWIEAENCCG